MVTEAVSSGVVPLLVITGPTASGKTQLALDLAEKLNGEIVNADSMQLYRGMDIGTAKASPSERGRIPHHLLDILEPTAEASVAVYRERARNVITEIRARGKTPLLVGGSGLYIRAVIDDIDFPPTDPALRERLYERLESEGAQVLRKELHARDPESAASITDERRLVRALEVTELTGRAFISFMPQRIYYEQMTPVIQCGLSLPANQLHHRIEERVQLMQREGLAQEVKMLTQRYPQGLSRTATQAIGYQQYQQVLSGQLSPEEAGADIVQATRRYAKRQLTWFRADPRIHWLGTAGAGSSPGQPQHPASTPNPPSLEEMRHQVLELINHKGC